MKKPTIVYTYGVFDLFHSGHVQLLKEARGLGDKLVVGLFTDKAAKGFKRQPVIAFKHRRAILQSLKHVDAVVIQNTLSPESNLKKIKPHILAKGPGAGWGEDETAPGEKLMKKLGGKVVKLNYHHGISTSEIIKKIKKG